MATLNQTDIENKSFLSPVGFKFVINKLPHVSYFCTAANIPDMTLGQIDTVDNTFIKLPVPGDHDNVALVCLSEVSGLGRPCGRDVGRGPSNARRARLDYEQGNHFREGEPVLRAHPGRGA